MRSKKKTSQPLDVKKLAAALQGIEEDRKLDKTIVEDALIEALSKAYRKHVEIPDVYVKVTVDNGKIHIYHQRMVSEDVEDDEMEISLANAKKVNPMAKIGDMIDEEVDFTTFDRAAVVLAKNVMKQKIREAEKQQVYEEYCDKENEMVSGTIEAVDEKSVIVNIGKTLAMMRRSDQIPTERYQEGQILPVVITQVNKDSKGAQVLVSRSTPVFVRRLFEREVPEIYNGIIEIKAIARDPGERCKIAVMSHNENIDPIGACIGPRGARVQTIINELGGEKIDIFQWSDDLQKLIKNALSPSEAIAVLPNPEEKDGLIVVVPDNQLSLAIGKKGKNARLAVKLSNHKIDIKSKSQAEELGIDYMALSQAMHDEYEERKAKERAYKQQQRIEEIRASNDDIEDISNVDFDFEEPESNDLTMHNTRTLYEAEQDAAAGNAPEQPAETEKPEEVQEKAVDEMEEAARIAREKRKEKSISDVSAYTSRFEEFAGTHKTEPSPVKKKEETSEEKEEKKEKKEKKKAPSFGEIKPIYTEEELAEIEEQEEEDEYGAWDDDIDYEEFDSFYDD